MRSKRARISCRLLLRAWPICSRPVTLGGGMTIEKASASGRLPQRKAPDASQMAEMRFSTSWGLKVLSSIGKSGIWPTLSGFFAVRSSRALPLAQASVRCRYGPFAAFAGPPDLRMRFRAPRLTVKPACSMRVLAFCPTGFDNPLYFRPDSPFQQGREMLVHPFADQRLHAIDHGVGIVGQIFP